METINKQFEYKILPVNQLTVLADQDARTGQRKVRHILVDEEALKPTNRFWYSLYARFGFNNSFFKYFRHDEVLERIAQVESAPIRLCIERDSETRQDKLLAVSAPNRPVVGFDDLMSNLQRYDGQSIAYADGIVESTHTPRATSTFNICGDDFSNRFLMSVPVDGYGLPNIYLSLLRHVCSNGAIGYAKAFRSNLALGRGTDDVNYSIVRALEGFGNDEGFAALRQRFEAAGKSWASVNEAQSLYRHLLKLTIHNHAAWDGAALVGDSEIAKLVHDNPGEGFQTTKELRQSPEELSSPILKAFHRMTGDVSRLYGLANPDALSVKRQRTLPVQCRTLDLINFVSEVGTHHADEHGARSSQAWLGSLISSEYDLENSCDSFGDFQDFFLDRRLNGEVAMDLQRLAN